MKFNWKRFKDKRIWLSLLLLVGLAWIFCSFYSKLSFPDTSYNFLGSTNKVKLDPGEPVTQVFTAKENNLNQIKVVLENTGIKFQEKIVFELADENCGGVIAEQTYHSYNFSPSIYYRFRFPMISDSLNQKYCLKITYFSPYDRGSNRPYLGATEDENLFQGQSYTNAGNGRTYENRTLQMRPSYGTGSFLGDLERLIARLSQYKPEFIKGTPLAALLLGTILGSLCLGYLVIFAKEEA